MVSARNIRHSKNSAKVICTSIYSYWTIVAALCIVNTTVVLYLRLIGSTVLSNLQFSTDAVTRHAPWHTRVPAAERKLIMVYNNSKKDANPLIRLLDLHSAIVFCHAGLLRRVWNGMTPRVARELYRCSDNVLSFTVDYMNMHLLSPDSPPWCGGGGGGARARSHGRRHMVQKRAKIEKRRLYCVPASKAHARRYCATHHVAVEVDHPDTIIKLSQYDPTMIKIVHLFDNRTDQFAAIDYSSLTENLGYDTTRQSLTENSFDVERAYQRFYLEDFKPARLLHSVLELYNFLDLALEDSVIQRLLDIGDEQFVSTMKAFVRQQQRFLSSHEVSERVRTKTVAQLPLLEEHPDMPKAVK